MERHPPAAGAQAHAEATGCGAAPRPRPVPCCAPRSFDCSSFHASKPNTKSTAALLPAVQRTPRSRASRSNQYGAALETTWGTEIGDFGWARPPKDPVSNPPGGRYPVRIESLGSGLYGFVTGTHYAAHKNNPATPWNDRDAIASCMVLNQNFGPFPGTPTDAMRATVAHEFNHSIQFGYGALTGFGSVDSVFVEGGATWMEDEVFDTSNDNYNYLWPSFTTPMGKYAKSPYPYWIVFRAMTEPFGTGNANGGEDDLPDVLGAALQGRLDEPAGAEQGLRGEGFLPRRGLPRRLDRAALPAELLEHRRAVLPGGRSRLRRDVRRPERRPVQPRRLRQRHRPSDRQRLRPQLGGPADRERSRPRR